MSETPNLPTVMAAPGVTPNDGHEHFFSPRNIIAFALVAGFLIYSFMPYIKGVPEGRAGDLIQTNGKVIETIVVLVIGFFFGTTVSAARTAARAESNAAAAGAAAIVRSLPPPPPEHFQSPLEIKPPAKIILEEPEHAEDDASERTAEAAAAPQAPGVQPGRVGPPE